MELYKILQNIMSEQKLTIADISRMCSLPDSTVRGILKRKQKSTALDVAFKLSDGLSVSLERLNGLPEREIKKSQGVKYMAFPERLKSARLAAGMTQQQVADAMGITNSTYCGYETGRREPDIKKIKLLSKILNTSGDILLDIGYNDAESINQFFHLTIDEKEHIKKYRLLDRYGKEAVDTILNIEHNRCIDDLNNDERR